MRKFGYFICLLIICGCAASAYYAHHLLDRPLFADGLLSADGSRYVVQSGTSVKQIATQISESNNRWDRFIIEFYGRWATRNETIKAGEFNITKDADTKAFFATLIAGKVIEYSFTVPEGWTYREMLNKLMSLSRIQHPADGYQADAISQALDLERGKTLEGLFFPDTYSYVNGIHGTEILRQAYTNMQTQIEEAWIARSTTSSEISTPYEALILASIIEKETGVEGERRKISGVFHNRLRIGMMLQTDPTVIYGMGDNFDGNLRRVDLETDTPYNTYTRFGLPPGPIALPGELSLNAAVNPESTTALYFVANGQGGHTFSNTLAEHNQAVADYLRSSQ
ncbi:MAG: endolytic transglycosylase MltG [Proteobacteria bacterium]|jgi:UPF0755 protein|nr:endolytic transglycosylase MltG [Pseudomonadota bacterium]